MSTKCYLQMLNRKANVLGADNLFVTEMCPSIVSYFLLALAFIVS